MPESAIAIRNIAKPNRNSQGKKATFVYVNGGKCFLAKPINRRVRSRKKGCNFKWGDLGSLTKKVASQLR